MAVLAGIARRARPRGPMEVLERAAITVDGGVDGDFRGTVKPGGRGRRQVTLMERADWDAAMAELGESIPWQERRANLLVDGFDIPQRPGTRVQVGAVVLEITVECDPCRRMEAVAIGLEQALIPDWRGGACSRVTVGGTVAVGDPIVILGAG